MANQIIFDLGGVLAEAGLTPEAADAVQTDKTGRLARSMVDALKREMGRAVATDTVIISADATAEGAIADAKSAFEKAGIPFTHFNEDVITLIRHDLELVRGKALEVLTHTFDHSWTTKDGRDLQKGNGYDGNVAAFLVWVVQTQRMGWAVSIPNTDDRLFRCHGGWCAPCFSRDGSSRKFRLGDVRGEWGGDGLLVAFRAI